MDIAESVDKDYARWSETLKQWRESMQLTAVSEANCHILYYLSRYKIWCLWTYEHNKKVRLFNTSLAHLSFDVQLNNTFY